MEKKSYFNLGRKLTEGEYQELYNWKEAPENKNLRFRRYDEIESRPNMYFLNYSKDAKDGEEWAYHPGFKKEKPLVRNNERGFSLFDVNRKLTKLEYSTLKSWISSKENTQRWRSGDINPKTNLIFFSYGQHFINGECWLTLGVFKKRLSKIPQYVRKNPPKIITKEDLGKHYNSRFRPKYPLGTSLEGKFRGQIYIFSNCSAID